MVEGRQVKLVPTQASIPQALSRLPRLAEPLTWPCFCLMSGSVAPQPTPWRSACLRKKSFLNSSSDKRKTHMHASSGEALGVYVQYMRVCFRGFSLTKDCEPLSVSFAAFKAQRFFLLLLKLNKNREKSIPALRLSPFSCWFWFLTSSTVSTSETPLLLCGECRSSCKSSTFECPKVFKVACSQNKGEIDFL